MSSERILKSKTNGGKPEITSLALEGVQRPASFARSQ